MGNALVSEEAGYLLVRRRHDTVNTELYKVSNFNSAILVFNSVAMGKETRVIYWFRTDLRLHDSPALKAALDLQPTAFWPVWAWDPRYVYRARVGNNRWQFLLVLPS